MKHPLFREEHHMFRNAVRDFVEKELAPHAEEWEEAEGFPEWVWTRLGELGYLGMRFPEEYGGGGLEYLFSLILSEELSRSGSFGMSMSIMVHTETAMPMLLQFGNDDLKQRFLLPGIEGKKIGAIAMTEPDAGSDLGAVRTKAERTSDGWVLDGQKMFITNGTIADFLVVLARTSAEKGYRGMSTFLVEKDAPGFTATKLHKLGNLTADNAELSFDHCLIPADNLLGEEGRGFYQMIWELLGERILAAGGCVGRAQVALDAAIQYAQERVQFGHPISEFQAIRHRIAELAAKLESERQFTYHLAWLYNEGEEPYKEASMAKLLAAQLGFEIADYALQVFGGYGYMMDSPIQRYWRDLRLFRITAGTDEIQKEIIAASIFPRKK